METALPMFLSQQLTRPVRSSDGVKLGRIVDLTVMYDIAHATVHRLGVAAGATSTLSCRGRSCVLAVTKR